LLFVNRQTVLKKGHFIAVFVWGDISIHISCSYGP